MSAIATVATFILLWAALTALLALVYWLWVVLVIDPLWMWKQGRRKEADATEKHERVLAEIDRRSNEIVDRLVEHYDAALNEIRRNGGH